MTYLLATSGVIRSLRRASRLLASALFVAAASAGEAKAVAAESTASAWQFEVHEEVGAPSGWIDVRENDVAGTRLRFVSDLHVRRSLSTGVEIAWRRRPESRWVLDLAGTSLSGDATAAAGTTFNGSRVVAGTRLSTRTAYADFLDLRLAYERKVVASDRWRLSGTAGLHFTALDFRLQGTIAADSPGHELDEDFVTQELPIPMFGLSLDSALSRRVELLSRLEAGWLPRIYSLRNEGGKVDLAQTEGDLFLGLAWTLERGRALELGARSSTFDQGERSREDGNRLRLVDTGLSLAFVWRPGSPSPVG